MITQINELLKTASKPDRFTIRSEFPGEEKIDLSIYDREDALKLAHALLSWALNQEKQG